jgi:thiazole synthase ThiGH ThiG subunit
MLAESASALTTVVLGNVEGGGSSIAKETIRQALIVTRERITHRFVKIEIRSDRKTMQPGKQYDCV